MSLNILPSIGAAGIYTLAAPLETLLTANTPYTCRAIRKLEDIVASGSDVFSEFYQPLGLTELQLQTDIANNATIVSLQSGKGDWAYVPDSLIVSYPDTNGIRYRAMVIGVALGTIPDTLNLDALQDAMVELAYHHIGVRASTKLVAVSKDQMVAPETHKTLEAVRQNQVTVKQSSEMEIASLKLEVVELLKRNKDLEEYIKKKLS